MTGITVEKGVVKWVVFASAAAMAFLVNDYRATPYDNEFDSAAVRYGIDSNLLRAIGRRESFKWWGKPIPDGDQGKSFGVMQVQRATADKVGYAGQDLRVARVSIAAAAAYLVALRDRELKGKFSLDTWIAAYNAGSPAIIARGVFNLSYVAEVKQHYYLYSAGRAFA